MTLSECVSTHFFVLAAGFQSAVTWRKRICNCPTVLNWRGALSRLQLGGERGYGWGDVCLMHIQALTTQALFGRADIQLSLGQERPQLQLSQGAPLLAHAHPKNLSLRGELDPLIGREWRSDQAHSQYAGQYLNYRGQAFAPGGQIMAEATVTIDAHGVWYTL